MSDLMESVGASAAGPVAAGAQFGAQQLDKVASYYMQKNLNRQAQANTVKNMKLAAELNSRQAFRAIAQSTSALKAAGLNPALATQGSFTATGVSNPAGTASSAPVGNAPDFAASLLAGKQIALLDAEKQNLEAQTKERESQAAKNTQDVEESKSRLPLNTKQHEVMEQLIQKYGTETLNIGADYGRKLAEDAEAKRLIMQSYDYRAANAKDAAERDYWLGLKESQGDLNVGTLWAMRDFSSYINDLDEYDKQMLFRNMQKQIMQMQIDDSSVLYDLAHMPEKEFEKLMAETADLYASRDLRKAYKEVGIPADAAYKAQMSKTMRHNDFVGNMSEGNYFDATMSQVPNLLSLFENALMLRYLKGARGAAVSSGVPESASDMASMSKGLAKGVFDRIKRDADKIKDPIKRAQYIDQQVRKAKNGN